MEKENHCYKISHNNIHYRIFLLCFALVFMTSCVSRRKAIREPLKEKGASFLLERLDSSKLNFNTLSLKFNAQLKEKRKTTNIKGQVRIQKDSLIWISFSPALGIEVGRLKVTRDSIFFINRLNKTYVIGNYQFVNDFLKTNIDFDIFQSLLTGNDFETFDTVGFQASIDNRKYKLSSMERRKLKQLSEQRDGEIMYFQNMYLDPVTFKITDQYFMEVGKEKKELHARYKNFKSIQNQLFPYLIEFKIEAENNIKLKVKLSKVEINDKESFPFKIPKKYKPLNIEQ
ncbi:MAG: DUF4292 domain-containing protein [Hyphomicrobiales bacterium]